MSPNESTPPPSSSGAYDPFSYPRLYPSGWNLDDLPEDQMPDLKTDPKGDSMPAWYEPFHDLRTFPSGWDLP